MGCLDFIIRLIYTPAPPALPPPVRNFLYGYQWQPNQGAPPADYDVYDQLADTRQPGIYVGFEPKHFDPGTNYFARAPDPDTPLLPAALPVFAAPNPVSAAMTSLLAKVTANPPTGA